jgi:hypothetical protein
MIKTKRKSTNIPTLERQNNKYNSDERKASLFGEILTDIFQNSYQMNNEHTDIARRNFEFFQATEQGAATNSTTNDSFDRV